MKRGILFFVIFSFVLFSLPLLAQKKISFGGGVGMSKLTGEMGAYGSFGLHYSAEGNYHFTKNLAAGAEYGNYTLGYGEMGDFFGTTIYHATAISLKTELIILPTKISPYVGFGIGLVKLTTPEIEVPQNGELKTVPSEQIANFGFSPRVGVVMGGLKLELAYNSAGRTPKTIHPQNTHHKPFNYFSFSMKYNFSIDFLKKDE